MLRVSLCVVVVHVALGLGVDDTEKRRSEEILRAVAAAATADYEGLQQMKFQKATTAGKISSTTDTSNCVAALQTALETEKSELEDSVTATDGVLGTDQTQVGADTTALKQAISKAIKEVYEELKGKYEEVKLHAAEMESALKAELNERTVGVGAQYSPAVLFTEIMENAVQQLKADGNDISDTMNGIDGTTSMIGGVLKEMMLESARASAVARAGNTSGSTAADNERKYIQVENLLLYSGDHNADGYDTFNADSGRSTGNPAQTGAGYAPTNAGAYSGYGDGSPLGRGSSATDRARENLYDDDHTAGPGNYYTELERANFKEVEDKFIAWTVSKSNFHNISTKKTALDAAIAMVQAKIAAVGTASSSVSSYAEELQGLEDDEMRKIHDIKEEFESLAADWLQLATYHCCDIVQGNAIECDDATAHLIAPINTVFPNALRKPNVQTDCTRRLL